MTIKKTWVDHKPVLVRRSYFWSHSDLWNYFYTHELTRGHTCLYPNWSGDLIFVSEWSVYPVFVSEWSLELYLGLDRSMDLIFGSERSVGLFEIAMLGACISWDQTDPLVLFFFSIDLWNKFWVHTDPWIYLLVWILLWIYFFGTPSFLGSVCCTGSICGSNILNRIDPGHRCLWTRSDPVDLLFVTQSRSRDLFFGSAKIHVSTLWTQSQIFVSFLVLTTNSRSTHTTHDTHTRHTHTHETHTRRTHDPNMTHTHTTHTRHTNTTHTHDTHPRHTTQTWYTHDTHMTHKCIHTHMTLTHDTHTTHTRHTRHTHSDTWTVWKLIILFAFCSQLWLFLGSWTDIDGDFFFFDCGDYLAWRWDGIWFVVVCNVRIQYVVFINTFLCYENVCVSLLEVCFVVAIFLFFFFCSDLWYTKI